MSWKTSIQINTNNPKVGSVSAVWSDPVLLEDFRHTEEQVNTDVIGAFKNRANAAKDSWVSIRTALKAKEVQLDAFMNT
jgi:hypothetical protein